MQERKSSIKDFIGVYDGYIPDEACDQAIELFNKYQEFNKVFSRFTLEGATQDLKQDISLTAIPEVITDLKFNINKLKLLMVNFDIALKNYYTETNLKKMFLSTYFATENTATMRVMNPGLHNQSFTRRSKNTPIPIKSISKY